MLWWQLRKRDADLERELRADLELEEEEQRERGLPPEEAHYAARRAFGNAFLVREQTHEAWGWAPPERLVQDLRYGARQLIRNPGFTVAAVMTLALGIGVNATIFSAVSAILLRKPPVKDPDTLCALSSRNIGSGDGLAWDTAPDFESWRKQNDVFEQMAAARTGRSFTLTGNFDPESVVGDFVTADFFSVIGVMPALGRTFLPSEDKPGSNHEVILSDSLWRERFGSNPGALGEDLKIDGEPYRVVGVMPPFAGISPGTQPQLWIPLVFSPQDLSPAARGDHNINLVLGRLKAGVALKQAQTNMNFIAGRLAKAYPKTNKRWGIAVLTLQEYNIRSEDVRNAMLLLMAAVGLVLLIACANVAGLLLTRGASRSREFAVRSALGASRGRILRQVLTENLLMGASSGVAGLLTSFCGIRLLRAGFDFNEYGKQIGASLRIDTPTLLFMMAITVLTTVLFGLLPAIRSSKLSPQIALSQAGRTASAGPESSHFRRFLVVAEIATAVILLTAAGVVIREVLREWNEPNGFNAQHLVFAKLDVSSPRYKLQDARVALYEQASQKVRNLPEVDDAAVDSCVPMGCFFSLSFDFVGRAAEPSPAVRSAEFYVVGPHYFGAMQIPILKGRAFLNDDNAQEPVVAIVNQEFARRFFPKGDAIGKRIEVNDGNHKQAQIVGIVGNVNNYLGQLRPHPQIYECYLQIPVRAFSTMSLAVRSRVPPAGLAPAIRRAVWSVDKAQPVEIRTVEELENDNSGGDKLMTGLMVLFAGLALGLAALGIYGVIAYSVAQRTREIGIRVALGAKKSDVLGLVLREGGVLIGIGCTLGALAGLVMPRVIMGLLSGFGPQGPLAVTSAAVLVILVSCIATWIPAHRAMNLDPVGALRSE